MRPILFYAALVALGLVLIVLGLGIYSLFKGGDFSKNWSNKLMRLRVLMQAIAIILLMIFVWWTRGH